MRLIYAIITENVSLGAVMRRISFMTIIAAAHITKLRGRALHMHPEPVSPVPHSAIKYETIRIEKENHYA